MWGSSKGGKSVSVNAMIGQLHQDDPDAVVIKFNTEGREKHQLTALQRKIWGIDTKRLLSYQTNDPEEIFDFIEHKIPELLAAGVKVVAVVIDSITDIQGRRAMNADSVSVMQRGDEASTLQDGLKRIKMIFKRNDLIGIFVAQARAEQDPIEVMRGKKDKMAGANYLKHFAEYFIHIQADETKDAKTDLLGNKFESNLKDIHDNNEKIAHKIKFKMQDSTLGPKGRVGEFTLHYYKGIINTHEEVFQLAINRNLVDRPNNRSYIVSDFPEKGTNSKYGSKEDFLTAIRDNSQLYQDLLRKLREQDINAFKHGVIEDWTNDPKNEKAGVSFDDDIQESSE